MSVTDSLSIQLYTLRSLEDLDRILDTVAGCRLPQCGDGRLASRQCRGRPRQARRARPQGLLEPCQPGGPAREARRRRRRVPDARPHASLHAGGSAGRARHGGGRLALARPRTRPDGGALSGAGHPPRLPQPPLGAEAEGRRQDRARADLRGRRSEPARLAGRRGLARARRCRSQGTGSTATAAGSPPPM